MTNTIHYRKYANRKFYDLDRGRYASVSDISTTIRRGSDIVVSCDRTGRDLTYETLARIFYEVVKVRARSKVVLDEVPFTAAKLTKLIRIFQFK